MICDLQRFTKNWDGLPEDYCNAIFKPCYNSTVLYMVIKRNIQRLIKDLILNVEPTHYRQYALAFGWKNMKQIDSTWKLNDTLILFCIVKSENYIHSLTVHSFADIAGKWHFKICNLVTGITLSFSFVSNSVWMIIACKEKMFKTSLLPIRNCEILIFAYNWQNIHWNKKQHKLYPARIARNTWTHRWFLKENRE